MRKLILSLFIISGSAFAAAPETVTFNFSSVPLITFAQATYKGLLNRDYVISPELIDLDKKVTMSIKGIDPSLVPSFVDDLLLSQGIKTTKKSGVYYLDLVKSDSVVQSADDVRSLGIVNSIHSNIDSLPGRDRMQGITFDSLDNPLPGRRPGDSSFPLLSDPVTIYKPINRPSEFITIVVNSAFSKPYARLAGSKISLSVPDEKIEDVMSFIKEIDSSPSTVEVSASFVEITRSGSSNHGLALVSSVLSSKSGFSLSPGSGSITVAAGGFQAVLDALDSDGRFKQVSNSRVVGDEYEKMVLSVGDETPTISTMGKDNQGNPLQSIVYRPSGVILDVLPKVLGSGAMTLAVDGQVSSFQATVNGVSGSPTLIKRQVKTSVTLKDGQVLIIGGLDDTKSTSSTSGFSFLPNLLSNRFSSDLHTDLVLILSAKVLVSKEVAGL